MLVEKSTLGLLILGGKHSLRGASAGNSKATRLAHSPLGLPYFKPQSARRKTRNLIGVLLGHGARAHRAAQPRTRVELKVYTPQGNPAVRIRV